MSAVNRDYVSKYRFHKHSGHATVILSGIRKKHRKRRAAGELRGVGAEGRKSS